MHISLVTSTAASAIVWDESIRSVNSLRSLYIVCLGTASVLSGGRIEENNKSVCTLLEDMCNVYELYITFSLLYDTMHNTVYSIEDIYSTVLHCIQ